MRNGDSLFDTARPVSESCNLLIKLNNIKSPDKVYVGDFSFFKLVGNQISH